MEPVDRASRDSGLGIAGAPGSVALVLPSHAPTPAATPMDFAQALLWQRVPMEPSGGVAKRWSLGRLSPSPRVPPLRQPPTARLLVPWIPYRPVWGFHGGSLTLRIQARMCIKSLGQGLASRRRALVPPWSSWSWSIRTRRENSWPRSLIWMTGPGRTRSASTS
jgi:hypothetical protein